MAYSYYKQFYLARQPQINTRVDGGWITPMTVAMHWPQTSANLGCLLVVAGTFYHFSYAITSTKWRPVLAELPVIVIRR